MKLKGYLLAAIAAATYGTNPAFAIPLYDSGMNANSVLLFRYLLGLPILAAMLILRGHNLRLKLSEVVPLMIVGVGMGLSSLLLFESYTYMNSGVASTLLFVYPLMVALMMVVFFHEKFRVITGVSLVLMSIGMFFLMRSNNGFALSGIGCTLVMVSAFTYAVYLVYVNVSKTLAKIPTLKLTFYILLFGCIVFGVNMQREPFTPPTALPQWGNLLALAVLPTVVSFCCTTVAIQIIGSTATAILGALEPVTAVVLSVVVLGQVLTLREMLGGILILIATTLVVGGDSISGMFLRVRRLFPRIIHKKT